MHSEIHPVIFALGLGKRACFPIPLPYSMNGLHFVSPSWWQLRLARLLPARARAILTHTRAGRSRFLLVSTFGGPAGWPGLPSRAKPQSWAALGATGLRISHRLTFRHQGHLNTAVRGRHPFGCVLGRLCSRRLGYLGIGLGLVDGLLNDTLLILCEWLCDGGVKLWLFLLHICVASC